MSSSWASGNKIPLIKEKQFYSMKLVLIKELVAKSLKLDRFLKKSLHIFFAQLARLSSTVLHLFFVKDYVGCYACLVKNLALVIQEEEQEGEEEDLVAPPPKMSKKSGDQEKKSGKQQATKKSGKRGQNTEEEEEGEVKPVMKSVIRKGEFVDPNFIASGSRSRPRIK
jgi:hypothetical protein